jgi:hypothetical protein
VDPRRGDWHRARSAQLDRPSVLAAGDAGVPHVRTGRPRRLQLGALAGSRARTPLPSELHLRGLPRLVRVRPPAAWEIWAITACGNRTGS